MTRKGGANLIATPESMSPDFAKWSDANCGRRGLQAIRTEHAPVYSWHFSDNEPAATRGSENASKPL